MRVLILLALALAVAGCGGSSASSPPPTDTPIRQLQFSNPPAMTIVPSHTYTATVVTDKGSFTIQLLPRVAPITVNNFVFLARHHYYDHNLFHRVIAGFMVQTGDPTGTGSGGPGYTFKDERVTMKYTTGTVAMANSGPNTNGSQFFVVVARPRASLPPNYTIFGKVVQGQSVADAISKVPVVQNPGTGELSQPATDVYVHQIIIHGSP